MAFQDPEDFDATPQIEEAHRPWQRPSPHRRHFALAA
jgi:hypothetical protein